VVWFLFWRLAYNLGLGWILKKQSNSLYFTHLFETLMKNPQIAKILKKFCLGAMYPGYEFEVREYLSLLFSIQEGLILTFKKEISLCYEFLVVFSTLS
jgi:hypothetical protein